MLEPNEMVFNANLELWQKVLLLLGWHLQVRIFGCMAQWGVTRKPLTEVDKECFNA